MYINVSLRYKSYNFPYVSKNVQVFTKKYAYTHTQTPNIYTIRKTEAVSDLIFIPFHDLNSEFVVRKFVVE